MTLFCTLFDHKSLEQAFFLSKKRVQYGRARKLYPMKACKDVVRVLDELIDRRERLQSEFTELNLRNMEDMISNEHRRADYLEDERRDIEEAIHVAKLEREVLETRRKVAEKELILHQRRENFILWQYNDHCQKENALVAQQQQQQSTPVHINPRFPPNNISPGMVSVTTQNCDSYRQASPRRGQQSPPRPYRDHPSRSPPPRNRSPVRNRSPSRNRSPARNRNTQSRFLLTISIVTIPNIN